MNVGLIVLAACIGAVAGSVATALSDRYQHIQSFVSGRSECPACHRVLGWYELVPVVSWVVLRGRCRTCHAPIGTATLLVELGLAAVGAVSVLLFGLSAWLVWLWCTAVLFGALAVVDLRSQQLPDQLLIAASIPVLLVGWLAPSVQLSPVSAVGGLLTGGGVLGGLWLGTKGKGMGLGDVKLAALLGLGLGWQLMLVNLFIAFVVGGAYAAFLLVGRKANAGTRVAFGPFLLVGYFTAVLVGSFIIAWYSGY